MAPPKNSNTLPFGAAHFALELDGKKDVGLFRSIEGGGLRADVMNYQYGSSLEKLRTLGKPKFEDMKLQVGMAMSKPFYDWIEKFFTGEAVQKNGAIVAADYKYVERARRDFTGALIKELSFPALNASDGQPAFLTITLAVEGMTFLKGSGQAIHRQEELQAQKEWSANKFTFEIDGFQQATRYTSKIDAFTIKQTIIDYHSGGQRAPIKCASQIDFPNIVFYIPESEAQPFYDHVKKRIVDGELKEHAADKKAGYLRLRAPDGKALATLEFFDADIISVTPDKSEANSQEIKQVKVEMYTERMKLKYP